MTIFIKNMVCTRCKMVIARELENLGIKYVLVDLGKVHLAEEMTTIQHDEFRNAIAPFGLVLFDNKKNALIQKIKNVLLDLIRYSEEPLSVNLSAYLANTLNVNYTYLANIFSESVGINIEKFFIVHKIEHVKELLEYSDLTLTEIAYKMHYASVSHISLQFKKITGMTTTHFKKLQKDKVDHLRLVPTDG